MSEMRMSEMRMSEMRMSEMGMSEMITNPYKLPYNKYPNQTNLYIF